MMSDDADDYRRELKAQLIYLDVLAESSERDLGRLRERLGVVEARLASTRRALQRLEAALALLEERLAETRAIAGLERPA